MLRTSSNALGRRRFSIDGFGYKGAGMRRTKLLLFSLILLCLATPARAADINAASCSASDVQTAINSASEGDRVLVPAGNCPWADSPRVIISGKGITLQGAGIGQTVITDDVATDAVIEIVAANTHGVIRVTGFTFDRNNTSKAGNNGTIHISATTDALSSFRLDHFELLELGGTGLGIFMDGLELSGVIDNGTFQMNLGSGAKAIRLFGAVAAAKGAPFSRPLELGTEKFIFIEDCTFNFSAKEDGAFDAFAGTRYVFRHNTVNNTLVHHHGADSGGFRGVHSFEIYNNTFDNTAASMRSLFFRSGTGVVFGNTWTGNYTEPNVANFRSRPQVFAPWGQCDGSSIWDENQPGESGYACLDQIGHVFTENSGGSNDLEPLYFWSNTLGGSPVTNVTVSEASMENHLQDGRDYFSNTQRPSYTSFAYPHPLRGEGSPLDPPTNLRVVVQ